MTILGLHTVGELKELISAKDYTIGQLEQSRATHFLAWLALDNAAASDWGADYTAFTQRYKVAHDAAIDKIKNASAAIRDSVNPAEGEYQAVLHALTTTPGSFVKGDFQDLYDRFVAGTKAVIDFSAMPQPDSSQDTDLNNFKATDTLLKKGEKKLDDLGDNAKTLAELGLFVTIGAGIAATYVAVKVGVPVAKAYLGIHDSPPHEERQLAAHDDNHHSEGDGKFEFRGGKKVPYGPTEHERDKREHEYLQAARKKFGWK